MIDSSSIKKNSKEFTSFCFNGSHKKNGKHRVVKCILRDISKAS